MTHTIEIDSVEHSFADKRVLQGGWINCHTGQTAAIFGRNGSGKSTLLRVMAGDLRPTFKSMRFDGVWCDQFTCNQLRYLPQSRFFPYSYNIKRVFGDFNLSVEQLLELFPEFECLLNQRFAEMSGGERRVLECYTVLSSDSAFVVLDEPFSGIDPVYINRIKGLINTQKHDKGIIITDHDYRNAISVADTMYAMSNGCVYHIESVDELVRYGYLQSELLVYKHNLDAVGGE